MAKKTSRRGRGRGRTQRRGRGRGRTQRRGRSQRGGYTWMWPMLTRERT